MNSVLPVISKRDLRQSDEIDIDLIVKHRKLLSKTKVEEKKDAGRPGTQSRIRCIHDM